MKCPEGFCRDAEHCMQGGRCEDAIGELTPLVNYLFCPTCQHHPDVEVEQESPEAGIIYDCAGCSTPWSTNDTETDRLATWALRVCTLADREPLEHDLRYMLYVLTEEIKHQPDVARAWWKCNSGRTRR